MAQSHRPISRWQTARVGYYLKDAYRRISKHISISQHDN
jgi:hypothetical protein